MRQWTLREILKPSGLKDLESLVGKEVVWSAVDKKTGEQGRLRVRLLEVGSRLAPTDIHGFRGEVRTAERTSAALGSYSVRNQQGDLLED